MDKTSGEIDYRKRETGPLEGLLSFDSLPENIKYVASRIATLRKEAKRNLDRAWLPFVISGPAFGFGLAVLLQSTNRPDNIFWGIASITASFIAGGEAAQKFVASSNAQGEVSALSGILAKYFIETVEENKSPQPE